MPPQEADYSTSPASRGTRSSFPNRERLRSYPKVLFVRSVYLSFSLE